MLINLTGNPLYIDIKRNTARSWRKIYLSILYKAENALLSIIVVLECHLA